jgi:DNA-binding SARP family transcriptional activator
VEFRLLGPLELVGDDGRLIELPAGKPRVLLGLLLLEAGSVVSVDRVVDVVWGERPPPTAAKVVQGYVSRLPKFLPTGVLETREPGYRLCLEEDQIDCAGSSGCGKRRLPRLALAASRLRRSYSPQH